MAKYTTFFGQLLWMVPKSLFDSLAIQHQVDKGVRSFSANAQFNACTNANIVRVARLSKT